MFNNGISLGKLLQDWLEKIVNAIEILSLEMVIWATQFGNGDMSSEEFVLDVKSVSNILLFAFGSFLRTKW